MELEQTLFCTAKGLLKFSGSLTKMFKTLIVHNIAITSNTQIDKLELWGESKSDITFCYGRHFYLKSEYDIWIGLVFIGKYVKIAIYDILNENLLEEAQGNFYTLSGKTYFMKEDYFEKFCENSSTQILVNFTSEVLKKIIAK